MRQGLAKNDIIRELQKEIASLQGSRQNIGSSFLNKSLGPIEAAFPGKAFPTGVVHEFLSFETEEAAATSGFISGLLGLLMKQEGICLWISTKRTLFPPALLIFGINPERIIFVDLDKQKDAFWAVEEALKCEALTAIVGEFPELSFTQSRRLQLAVEKSRVTGFIHRHRPKTENAVACVTRWKIKPVPSETEIGMPGVGFPRWDVQLLKVRNGRPGEWKMEWAGGRFRPLFKEPIYISDIQKRKTG